MQSTYHNLPMINGLPQSPGSKYKASNSTYKATKSTVAFSVDIANAYPAEAKVNKWLRDYTLLRNKELIIKDEFSLAESFADTELHFITPLNCKINSLGSIDIEGKSFTLEMKYNPMEYNASIKPIHVDDPKLLKALGDKLFMIVLKANFEKTGKYSIYLKKNN